MVKIVNNLDAATLSQDIKEKITHFNYYNNNSKSKIYIHLRRFEFAYVCMLGLYIVYKLLTVSYSFFFVTTAKISAGNFLFYLSINFVLLVAEITFLGDKIGRFVTETHIRKINEDLEKAQDLTDISEVLNYIISEFKPGKLVPDFDMCDIRRMAKVIAIYEEVKDKCIVRADYKSRHFNPHTMIHLTSVQDGSIYNTYFLANVIENTQITEDELVFDNWNEPVYKTVDIDSQTS